MDNPIEDIKFLQNIVQNSSEGILITDDKGILLNVNQSAEKIFGYDKGELIQKKLSAIFPKEFIDYFEDQNDKDLPVNNTGPEKIVSGINKNGLKFPLELKFTTISHRKEKMTVLFVCDVKHENHTVILKNEFRKILWMIGQNKPIDLIGDQFVNTIESYVNNGIGAILTLDKSTNTLRKLSAPNFPPVLASLIEEVAIGSDDFCCGTAAYEKEEIIIENIADNSKNNNYKKLLLKHDFKSCWSFPILSSNCTVLGTLIIYSKQLIKPQKIKKEFIIDTIQLMSIAIEQHNSRIILQQNKLNLEKYNIELEDKVKKQTDELSGTIKSLVETNLNLKDQIQIANEAIAKRQESQAMLLAIAKNFPKGIIIVIGSDFLIKYIEGEELDTLGLNEKIYEGLHINAIDIFPNNQIRELKENVIKTLKGEHCSFEITFGNNAYSVNSTPLFESDSNKIQILLVLTNITDQKIIQLEMLGNLRKEKELNELKSGFISLASHEFRTPLSVILSSTILIEKQNSPGNEKKIKKSIGKIRSNVNNLRVILDDFLSLSKLEEGKIQSQPVSFNLIELSKSLIEEINPSKNNGQTVRIYTDLREKKVYHDPNLIRYILTNLLSNAMKYSLGDSDPIRLEISRHGKQIIMEVKDNGIGIPKEEQKNLFQRFYRASNATHFQGTGLGLYLVKQYTELVGGTINFKSELSKGSTFWIELPINQLKDEKSISN